MAEASTVAEIDTPVLKPAEIGEFEEEKAKVCYHSDSVYYLRNSLWQFSPQTGESRSQTTSSWSHIFPLPFRIRDGQSMTSTPKGLVFFGGMEDGPYYHSDLWTYEGTDWTYVQCDVPGRSHHAVVWDQHRERLVISGGIEREGYSSDIYLIDIGDTEGAAETTVRLKVPNMPALAGHSITALGNDRFVIFGGSINVDEAKGPTPSTTLYILDLAKLSIEPVETEFANAGFSGHSALYLYDRLFVFGGRAKLVWFFDFFHKLWVPMRFGAGVIPILVFSSPKPSQQRALHALDRTLARTVRLQIFTEPVPADVSNHPQFIAFLEGRLQDALEHFRKLKSPSQGPLDTERAHLEESKKKLLQNVVKQGYVSDAQAQKVLSELQPDIERAVSCRQYAEKLQRILDSQPPPVTLTPVVTEAAIIPKEKLSVSDIVADLRNVQRHLRTEIANLEAEAQGLANQIECATFACLGAKFPAQFAGKEKGIGRLERQAENSRQIACEIVFLRQQLQEELAKVESGHKQRKESELFIREQLWLVACRTSQLNRSVNDTCKQYYDTLAQLIGLRNDELQHAAGPARDIAKALLEIPQLDSQVEQTLGRLKDLRERFGQGIAALVPEHGILREEAPTTKVAKLQAMLKEFGVWAADAKRKIGSDAGALNPARHKETKRKKMPASGERSQALTDLRLEGFPPFMEALGKNQEFIADVDSLLTTVEGRLNELARKPR